MQWDVSERQRRTAARSARFMVDFPFWIIRTTDEVNAQDACQRRGQHWAFSTRSKADDFIARIAPDADWEIREVQREDATAPILELNAKHFIELCLDPEPRGGGSVIRLSDIARAMQDTQHSA